MKVFAVTVRVKKNKIEEAKNFFQSFIHPSRSEPGCIQYDLFQCLEDPQIFYFFEKWKDEESFKKHLSLPAAQTFHDRHDELAENPSEFLALSPIE